MAIDSIVKIAGTGTAGATSNDVASIDIAEDGFIVGILGYIEALALSSGDAAIAELSFLSTQQQQANDARGSIMEIIIQAGAVVTSGNTKASENVFMSLPEGIPVAAGERIHLHTFADSGVTPLGVFMLYLSFSPGTGRRAQRRR